MSRNIEAIKTVYRGTTYRSRLEATWAAMFDLMEWEWSYECDPIGGWLPDFVVKTKYPADRMYVEVKPSFDLDDEAAREGRSQIDKSDLYIDLPEALLLGRGPFHHKETGLVRLGWLYQWTETDGSCGKSFGMAFPIMTWRNEQMQMGLIGEYGDGGQQIGFVDRISWERWEKGNVPLVPSEYLMGMWGKAKDTVSYRPPRAVL